MYSSCTSISFQGAHTLHVSKKNCLETSTCSSWMHTMQAGSLYSDFDQRSLAQYVRMASLYKCNLGNFQRAVT